MRRYSINNFYVGILNFPFNMGNMLYKDVVSKSQKERKDLFVNTVLNGAIDLRSFMTGEELNWTNRTHTIKLFTLFYKVDDVHYLCLHNKNYYNTGIDYCNELVKLTDVLPKIDIIYDDSLSFMDALKLFKYLFCYNNLKICGSAKTNFKIEDFYQGTTSLCTNYYVEEKNALDSKSYFMNLPEHLIFLKNNYLYKESGYAKKDHDNIEYSYSNYDTLFIKTPNGKYYNLNNYSFYDLNLENEFDTKITIEEPFVNKLKEKGIVYPSEVTIPKVLKLQKKLYDRKK